MELLYAAGLCNMASIETDAAAVQLQGVGKPRTPTRSFRISQFQPRSRAFGPPLWRYPRRPNSPVTLGSPIHPSSHHNTQVGALSPDPTTRRARGLSSSSASLSDATNSTTYLRSRRALTTTEDPLFGGGGMALLRAEAQARLRRLVRPSLFLFSSVSGTTCS